MLDSHCKCCFIIMPEAVCYCVVSVDGQLDTRTLCLTWFNWKIWLLIANLLLVTALQQRVRDLFVVFPAFPPSPNVYHGAAVQCVVVRWKWIYPVTRNSAWCFHDHSCGSCLQSWEVVPFTNTGLASSPSRGVEWASRLVRDAELRLLSVFLTLCHLDLARWGRQQPRGQWDKASAVVVFSRRSSLRM